MKLEPYRRCLAPLEYSRTRCVAITALMLVVICPALLSAQSADGFDPYQIDGYREPLPIDFPAVPPLPWDSGPSPLAAEAMVQPFGTAPVGWEALPTDTIYPFYLGDLKASRLSAMWTGGDEGFADATVGGRFGLLRHNRGRVGPYLRGTQVDVEGSANLRLIPDEDMDLRAVDFRAGVPISFGFGRLHTRLGYYHLSSHLGDEFLLRRPNFPRLNFSRDVLFTGAGFWLTPQTRIYGEAGWAFYNDISEEWEFMFGLERAPRFGTGIRGGLFYSLHVHLREEVDFGGHFNGQLGWAWRRDERSGLLRVGLNYANGKSPQYSFFQRHEQQVGFGMWYDF